MCSLGERNGCFYDFVFDSHAIVIAHRKTDGVMIPLM